MFLTSASSKKRPQDKFLSRLVNEQPGGLSERAYQGDGVLECFAWGGEIVFAACCGSRLDSPIQLEDKVPRSDGYVFDTSHYSWFFCFHQIFRECNTNLCQCELTDVQESFSKYKSTVEQKPSRELASLHGR